MASLSIFDLRQEDEWHRHLRRFARSDIYFTPGYCKIYEDNGEGLARLAVYENADGIVYYPYLQRSIDSLPGMRRSDAGRGLYDITTPYGYGGPICSTDDAEGRAGLHAEFEAAFARHCRADGIVTEFVRLHPLLRNAADYAAAEPEFVRNTVAIDLRPDAERIIEQYRHDTRNRVRKAEKEGLTARFSEPAELDAFYSLYGDTMTKTGASDYYFFSRSFFRHTADYLDPNVELIEVLYQDRVINAALLLYGGDYAHYHLSGSDKNYLWLAPNNLLLHSAALRAKSKGCLYLHMGGGYTGNDQLYRFKKGFNRSDPLEFYIGKRVHYPDIYAELVAELDDDVKDSGYFPLYRHPSMAASAPEAVHQA